MKPIDPALLAIFESEQREHLERIRTLLAASGAAALEEVFRRAHTLKGAARAVGLTAIEALAHHAEAVFARVREGKLELGPAVLEAIRKALDAMEDTLACVLAQRLEPDVSGAAQSLEEVLGPALVPHPPAEPVPAALAATAAPDMVRVSARRIDDLVRSSSQLLAANARQLRVSQQFDELCRRIQEVQREWVCRRQRAAARWKRLPADDELLAAAEPLNYADAQLRSLASLARLANLQQQRGTWALHQLGTQLHENACRARMTPAETVFGAFRKMVRDLARDEGKEVELRAGLDVEADRLVLQGLKDPVLHLLRNAISHGIETPRERRAAGKPAAGAVDLTLEAQGGLLRVTVADDGRGIDLARVAEVAVSRGLIAAEAATSQSPDDLARFLLQPGFSTSPAVTRLAGRGMGLAVVHDQMLRMHGEVAFAQRNGPGTCVVLSVPLTIATHHVLLVACGRHTFAIPTRAIERLCRIRPQAIESFEGREAIRAGGGPVALAKLADILELPAAASENGQAVAVVVLRSGRERAGLVVDELLDERQAVIKDLGISGTAAGISIGGLPLEDGTVAVVLSPAALLERCSQARGATGLRPVPAGTEKAARILVVDDSITTRSLERSILEAHGYQVRLAVDGLDALEQLRVETADLVIADLMMPRMDGFQLLEHMKKDPRLARIPVIVVTSMERREEQERGLALGADAYIVKRKFDQKELLNTVRQIL